MNAAPKAVTMFERINTLLEINLKKILNNELHNEDRIHLYDVGEYWVAFEKSAYLLEKINPKDEQPLVLYMKGYPFPIVMHSVYYTKVNDMCRKHPMSRRGLEYLQIMTKSIDNKQYTKWYRELVIDEDMPII